MKLSKGNSEQSAEPLVLAVDTSSSCAGYALAQPDRVLASLSVESLVPHSQAIFDHLSVLLRLVRLELRHIELLAVVTGPGSFTGLRVGLSAVKGLSFSLRKPVVGLNALDLLALGASFSGRILAVINAGRGEVYVGLRELSEQGVLARLATDQVGQVASVLSHLLPLIGKGPLVLTGAGAVYYQAEIIAVAHSLGLSVRVSRLIDGRFDGWQIKTGAPPLAPELALRAASLLEAGARVEAQAYYLRAADAELKSKEADRQ